MCNTLGYYRLGSSSTHKRQQATSTLKPCHHRLHLEKTSLLSNPLDLTSHRPAMISPSSIRPTDDLNETVHPSLGTRCQNIELSTSYDHISVNATSAGMQNVWSEITRKRTLESGTPAGMQNVWSEITIRGLWENGTPAGINAWSEITKKRLWENCTPAGIERLVRNNQERTSGVCYACRDVDRLVRNNQERTLEVTTAALFMSEEFSVRLSHHLRFDIPLHMDPRFFRIILRLQNHPPLTYGYSVLEC